MSMPPAIRHTREATALVLNLLVVPPASEAKRARPQ